MIDIKQIREGQETLEKILQTKEPGLSLKVVVELDGKLRQLKTDVEQLKARQNGFSKQIGELKRKGGNAQEAMDAVATISKEIHEKQPEIAPLEQAFIDELAKIPNIPMEDVKVSQDIAENVVIKTHKEKPTFSFPFKNHLELNEKLHLFDFQRGAKITGAGWPVYRNLGARLEWGLINYMIDIQLKNGFEQFMLPALVRPEVLFGSGQLPKFEDQQFKIRDEDYNLYLIPTAEVALNGLHYDEILDEEELPKKYMAYTPCFRREAGAAGSTERGLIRTHQFNKVEMFCFTKPEESQAMFDTMVASAEEVVEGLGLHYRSVLLVTGDMSFAAARTIDIEVWLPGQDRYYEVSSISNCTDYQARRSQTRYRSKGGKPTLVHTLNGSGVATSRLMVGLLENNQNSDGSVNVPEVLQKYVGCSVLVP